MTKLNIRAPKMINGPAVETMLVGEMEGRGKSVMAMFKFGTWPKSLTKKGKSV